MTIGAIRNAIRVAPQSAGLRTEFIQTTLNRLREHGAVHFKSHKNKPTYYVTELGRRHTDEATKSAVELFNPVLNLSLAEYGAVLQS